MKARPRAARGQGDALREEILVAAERLLVETASEDAVSIRAVAEAVGVTPPSIYRHFPDKAHLLFEVCARSFERFSMALGEATSGKDPVEDFRRLAHAYVAFGLEHPEHYRIMFMNRSENTPPDFALRMLADDSGFRRALDAMEAADADGLVNPDMAGAAPLELALLLWASVHGLTSLLIARPEAPWPEVEQAVDRLIDVTTRGVFGGPRAGPRARATPARGTRR